MTSEELSQITQLQRDIQVLTEEMRNELKRLAAYAERADSLAVASVAYRVRQVAQRHGMVVIQEGASRIEESARRNNVAQFTSDIKLLDHQVRWYSQTAPQPF
ncbi:MAG: hypothetical protein MUF23_04605 [Pirellula sp.]|jgi:hypothetical protein|nr:hypothetical protein [Pirellula sp.]